MTIIPDEYRQYVETINGTGSSQFFWQSLTDIPLMYHTEYTISADYGNKTYFVSNTYDPIISSANNTNDMYYMPKKDIHINKVSGTQYSVSETYSYTTDLSLPPLWGNPSSYSGSFRIQGGQLLTGSVLSSIESKTYTYSDSGTLQEILTRLARNCRGINIYVDGVPWDDNPDYQWQSVPSVSGKNGILSLVTLDSESINDGEPVSGAAVSVFDQNPVSGNNVKDIVDGNTPLIPSAVDVTAAFIISNPPVGELASRILAAKKDSIPESIEDADKTVSIPANASNVTMPGLDENSQYYFAIFVADATGDTAVSDPKDIYTSGDEGWLFDYTGAIQIFTAPKTGIYSIETWGAQGGDATDGTNTARGGYGAYAYGEVLLQQGETIYINVGGKNGYGGGGVPPVVPPEYQAQIDQINGDSGSGYDFYWKSYTTWDGSHLVEAPFDSYSWSKKADESQDLIIDGRPFDTRYMYPNTKFDVYIDGEGSSYQLKLHDYQGREDGVNWSGSRAYKCYANTTQMVGATPSTSYSYDYFLNNYVYYTGTISGCLDYIIANFRNVNIYVNGVQWASV